MIPCRGSDRQLGSDGSAWHSRAGELADWTLAHLVNRLDARGGYNSFGQVTRRGQLTLNLLARHFQARSASDIIGLHTAGADNRSKGGAIDIDQHGDDSARTEANRVSAVHWYGTLRRSKFRPLLTTSNGRGGYHLRLLLAEPIEAGRVYQFLRQLTGDHAVIGMAKRPEVFPKQPDVRECAKGLGNWIRAPGRHHKREYWSEVWDGSRWLAGGAAVSFILALTGDDPALVPHIPPPAPMPRRQTYRSINNDNLSRRIANYLARLPNLSEGQGRDDVAFRFAAFLARDLGISDNIALQWLERWDSGNNPPKGRERLAQILRSAHCYGKRPIGCGLAPERRRFDRQGHRILRVSGEVE